MRHTLEISWNSNPRDGLSFSADMQLLGDTRAEVLDQVRDLLLDPSDVEEDGEPLNALAIFIASGNGHKPVEHSAFIQRQQPGMDAWCCFEVWYDLEAHQERKKEWGSGTLASLTGPFVTLCSRFGLHWLQ